MEPSPGWIINIIFLISNNNLSNTTQKFRMLDHRIFILTTNYIHDKICITSTKGYSSVGRAPRLHARQCFSGESVIQSKNGSYWEIDVLLHNFEGTIAWQMVRSDLGAHLGTKQTPSLIWDIDKVNTSTFNARHNEYKVLKKSLFVLWTLRCMKFHIWLFEQSDRDSI